MSTTLKEWLVKTITELEEERNATPGAVNEDAANALAAMKLALASLEAEPVAYIFKHPAGRLFWSLTDESNKGQSDVMPVYTAPPAPVAVPDYPEILPCPVMLEPGLRFGKGVTTRTMLGALQRRAGHCTELEAMTPEQRAEHEAGMKEFAAMLQGAEPVATAYKLPDGWVACSERMPEENAEQEVLACFKGGDISTLYYFEGRWDDAYGIVPIRQDVTHWMPLPAAPQQGDSF